ncbi:hypothetical protein Hanom_Chr16g01485811 [Helianthus anomalus]
MGFKIFIIAYQLNFNLTSLYTWHGAEIIKGNMTLQLIFRITKRSPYPPLIGCYKPTSALLDYLSLITPEPCTPVEAQSRHRLVLVKKI